MYAREIGSKVYTFGVSGKLLRNTLVMYDHQTGSEWSQLLGEALTGPLKGTRLQHLASSAMTWKEWRERYPNTLALSKPAFTYDVYQSYYESSEAGIVGETVKDNRLPTKQRVIGVRVGGTSIAYSYSVLEKTPVLNHTVSGKDLLITFDVTTSAAAVFERTIEGKTLTFEAVTGDGNNIKDKETSTTWNKLTGQAIAGPLKDKALTKVPFTTAFWFGWKDNYPNTLVYGQ